MQYDRPPPAISAPAPQMPGSPGRGRNTVSVGGQDWGFQNSGASEAVMPLPNGYRFHVSAGDTWANDVKTHNVSERSEISSSAKIPVGETFGISFDQTVEPGPPTTSDWTVIGQLHQELTIHSSPPWAQRLDRGDDFKVSIRTSTDPQLRVYPKDKILFEDHNFHRGQTYHMDYVFRFDPMGNGRLSAWRDGVRIIDYHGPVGYIDPGGNYFKLGIYRAPSQDTLDVVYRNVNIRRNLDPDAGPDNGHALNGRHRGRFRLGETRF